ncbi:MAG: pentapeptide repeat-containing protein [Desulfosarcinaceae bacterium]|nr:pentapeptide repeat-containing protein [Desulfosarcinaceae bacterium]
MSQEQALREAIVAAIRDGLREVKDGEKTSAGSKQVDPKFTTLVVSIITAMIAFLGGVYQVNRSADVRQEELIQQNQFQSERDVRAQKDLLELERQKLMQTIFLDILQKADDEKEYQDVIRANIGALRVFERSGLPYLIMVRDFWKKKGRGQFVDYADRAIREILLSRMKISEMVFSQVDHRNEPTGRANLRRVDFSSIDFTNADFRNCDLDGASFRNTVLTGADFTGASLEGVALHEALDVAAARFSAADLLEYYIGVPKGIGPFANLSEDILLKLLQAHKKAFIEKASDDPDFEEKFMQSKAWSDLQLKPADLQ